MTTTGEWAAAKLNEAERPGRIERAARELYRLTSLLDYGWELLQDHTQSEYRACAASILDAADGEEVRP